MLIWGTSLAVQGLRLHSSTAGDTGSIPGQGSKIPHALCRGHPPQKSVNFKEKELFLFFLHGRLFILKINKFYIFRAVLGLQEDHLKNTRSSHVFPPPHSLSYYFHLYWCDTFVIIDAPILVYYY